MDPSKPIQKRQSTFLPHWEQDGATYAITFRLADSLPASVVAKLAVERRDLERELKMTGRLANEEDIERFQNLCSEKFDALLDDCSGECVLRDQRAARVVADTLKHFDGVRYELDAWCVMPNHVHVVVTPRVELVLEKMLHSWKQFSAKAINKELHRSGVLWQREYYDHLIRNERDWRHCVRYVMDNPTKAGLKNWLWSWMSPKAVKILSAD